VLAGHLAIYAQVILFHFSLSVPTEFGFFDYGVKRFIGWLIFLTR